jgi:endonuclease YncB( thermonuclease family)
VNEKLSYEQIRQAVQELNQSNSESSVIPPVLIPSLECIRAPLHTYALVDKTKAQYPRGMVVVDCGFNIWRKVPRNQIQHLGKASYTYPARVESVIDGDTIWAVIDCGFDTFVREKLRFHKIDTPELGTPEGEKARRYVRRVLKASPRIVVCTHSYDKYARYLADIFYLPGVSSYERICSDGLYLNQELLDKGLAQPMY